MKTLKKLLSYILILAVVLASTVLLASAAPTLGDMPSGIVTQEMNELTARAAVNTYFAERLTFLSGNSESIPSAVSPITNDELLHRNALIDGNISYISFTLEFLEINCWDDVAEVTVEETVIYLENLTQKSITVSHEIVLYNSNSEETVIGSDGYLDSIVNFESASYLTPNSDTLDPMVAAGSSLCILHVAAGEVGYVEEAENTTKYGAWYGLQDEWCAMFVSWCAYNANVSTSVIMKNADPVEIKNQFSSQSRHYQSQAYEGTYTPVAGDLIFMRGTPSSPGHIGFVVSVSGNTVRVIDGNWGKKVCDRQITLSNTDIVGYGHPNYGSSNHTGTTWHSSATQHYKVCSNCSCAFSHAAHIYNQKTPQSPYVCRICGYTRNNIDLEV